jgi:predicted HicB family RNase H-like nuclease
MRSQRPVLDEQKVEAFLEKTVMPADVQSAKQHKSSQAKVPSKNGKKRSANKSAPPTKAAQRLIGKFMIEMPMELRQKIKFKSVATGIAMNELIVKTLKLQFK